MKAVFKKTALTEEFNNKDCLKDIFENLRVQINSKLEKQITAILSNNGFIIDFDNQKEISKRIKSLKKGDITYIFLDGKPVIEHTGMVIDHNTDIDMNYKIVASYKIRDISGTELDVTPLLNEK